MYIRKICGCILIVNNVCLHHSSFWLLFVSVIYSIKSKSLNIYHIYKIDNNSRGSRRGGSNSVSLFLSLDGRGFVSVDEEGLLAERVDQDHAAAAVVSIRW